jgi:hypothetical protein
MIFSPAIYANPYLFNYNIPSGDVKWEKPRYEPPNPKINGFYATGHIYNGEGGWFMVGGLFIKTGIYKA